MNWFFIITGALLISDTLFILTVSNINIGVILPAILGTPLLIYGIFYSRFFLGALIYVRYAFLILYIAYIAVTLPTIAVIAAKGKKHPPDGADTVIVLGAAVHGYKISLTLQNRLDAALLYCKKEENKNALIVVSGAQGRQENVSEAFAMKNYLLTKGIAESRIVFEDKATNTYENFMFSKKLLDERFKGEYSVVFVTNDFHILRSEYAAKKAGLKAAGLGCSAKAYIQPNNYLRESVAVLKYLVFGVR